MSSGYGGTSGSGSGSDPVNWFEQHGYPPESSQQPPTYPITSEGQYPNYPTSQYPATETPSFQMPTGMEGTGTQPPVNMQSISDALIAATNAVNETRQYVADQITRKCTDCASSVVTAQNYIVTKIAEKIEQGSDCYSRCEHSLATQIANIASVKTQADYEAELKHTQDLLAEEEAARQTQGSSEVPPVYVPGVTNPNEPLPNVNIVIPQQNEPGYIPGIGDGRIPPPPIKPLEPVQVPTCPPPTKRCGLWDGFCNVDTGEVIAVYDNQEVPTYPFVWAGQAGDEAGAKQVAKAWCEANKKYKPKPPGVTLGSIGSGVSTIACDLNDFQSKEHLRHFFSDIGKEEALAQVQGTLNNIADTLMNPIGSDNPIASSILGVARGATKGPIAIAEAVIPKLVEMLGCLDPLFLNVAKLSSLMKYWEKQTGLDFSSFRKIYDYTMNIQCRQAHLTPGEGLQAYLADAIGPTQIDLLWGIHNLCHTDLEWAIEANRSKPNFGELAIGRRRGKWDDAQYTKMMRELGFLDPTITEKLFELTEQVPAANEIIRFMVRDVDDPNAVEEFQLDTLFNDKFGGELKQWAEMQGITEKQMLYNWRAHWNAPSPGQLFQFWQRLRRNPDFGTPQEQEKKIRSALIYDDMMPTWIDSFFAVQYNPLGQRQLRQGYRLGTIDADKLNDGFAALGYNDKDCDTLTEMAKREKIVAAQGTREVREWISFGIDGAKLKEKLTEYGYSDDEIKQVMEIAEQGFRTSEPARAFVAGELSQDSLKNQLGGWGMSENGLNLLIARLAYNVHTIPEIDDYAIGTVTRGQAEQAAQSYGMASERAKFLLDKIDRTIKRQSLANCIKGVRRKLELGELDHDKAIAALVNSGLTAERAGVLVDGWNCERATRGKQPATNKLCEWLGNGSISATDFVDRLKTIGWSEDDAIRLLSDCFAKINQNQAKRAEREAKDQAARLKAEKAAQEKAAKLFDQINTKQARGIQISLAAKQRRERQFNRAVALVEKNTTCPTAVALAAVSGAQSAIRSTLNLSLDETLQIMVTTAESLIKGADCQGFVDKALLNAKTMILAQLGEGLPYDISPNSNGASQPAES